jgi:mono/diheme cytochrome c family protein
MSRSVMSFAAALAMLAVCLAAGASSAVEQAPAPRKTAEIERGRYIAMNLAMCVQCHTPRDEQGDLRRDHLFEGAPIPVKSPFPNEKWALRAPGIAGLTAYTDAEAMRLFTEGIARDGRPPLRPMPPFRMTPDDARAVIAFLRSLR